MNEIKTEDIFGTPKKEWLQITRLNLNSKIPLTTNELPNEICLLKNVREIKLHGNPHLSFSHTFRLLSELPMLEKIELQDNELSELPQEIGFLTQLQYLNLSNNNLQSIPESISNLKLLKDLNLKNNQLKSLPKGIGNLRSLKSINFLDNDIEYIPVEFGNLTNLNINGKRCQQGRAKEKIKENLYTKNPLLDLSGLNLFTLPLEFYELSHLEELNLSFNYIVLFEPEIVKLTKLVSINLTRNYIKKFPSELCILLQLKTLVLDDNLINKLPKEISQLRNLMIFSMADSLWQQKSGYHDPRIELAIPDEFYSLKNLESIDFTNHYQRNISPKIGELKNIKILKLEGNVIEIMPSRILSLKNLEYLDLKYQIEYGWYYVDWYFTEDELGGLFNYKYKNRPGLNSNFGMKPIRINIKEALHQIQECEKNKSDEISFENFNLFYIPDDIFNLTHLKKLNLAHNYIKDLSPQIARFKNLEELILHDNLFKNIPLELLELKTLKLLSISENCLTENDEETIRLLLKDTDCEILIL